MAMNDASIVQATGWHTRGNLTGHHSPALTDLLREPTRQATFFGAILVFVFIFFGLVGNIILITAILSVKKLRSNIINIFIVSVSDDSLSARWNNTIRFKRRAFAPPPALPPVVVFSARQID